MKRRKPIKIGDTVYVCGDVERRPEIITDMFTVTGPDKSVALLEDYWRLKRRPFRAVRFDSGGTYAPLSLCIPL